MFIYRASCAQRRVLSVPAITVLIPERELDHRLPTASVDGLLEQPLCCGDVLLHADAANLTIRVADTRGFIARIGGFLPPRGSLRHISLDTAHAHVQLRAIHVPGLGRGAVRSGFAHHGHRTALVLHFRIMTVQQINGEIELRLRHATRGINVVRASLEVANGVNRVAPGSIFTTSALRNLSAATSKL